MNTRFSNKILFRLFYIVNIIFSVSTLFLYSLIKMHAVFGKRLYAGGDEFGFVKSLEFFIEKGFWEFSVNGGSTLYILISSVFFFLTKNTLLALRISTLFASILMIFIFYVFFKKVFKFSKHYILVGLISVSNVLIVSGFWNVAYNDNLFILLSVIVVYLIVAFSIGNISLQRFSILFGVFFSLMFCVRPMAILFLAPLMIILYFLKDRITLKACSIAFGVFMLTMFSLNFPSILKNGKISINDKGQPHTSVNWTQFQYYTAKLQDEGKINYGSHTTIEKTLSFLEENGSESLPKTLLSSLIFDPVFTCKEFVRDYFREFKYILRLSGVIGLLTLFICLFSKNDLQDKILIIFSLGYMLLICLIVISYIETRWLIGSYMIFVLYGLKFLSRMKKQDYIYRFFSLQLFMIGVMNIKYIYMHWNKVLYYFL